MLRPGMAGIFVYEIRLATSPKPAAGRSALDGQGIWWPGPTNAQGSCLRGSQNARRVPEPELPRSTVVPPLVKRFRNFRSGRFRFLADSSVKFPRGLRRADHASETLAAPCRQAFPDHFRLQSDNQFLAMGCPLNHVAVNAPRVSIPDFPAVFPNDAVPGTATGAPVLPPPTDVQGTEKQPERADVQKISPEPPEL